MDAEFWHQRWESNQIGFHEGRANELLVSCIDKLPVGPGARYFLPLCGKTRDIAWLLHRGNPVVGAELSELAVRQLFKELGMAPKITQSGPLTSYTGEQLTVFVGDIFALNKRSLGPVDVIFDRAALVALPQHMRQRYSSHLVAISDCAQQLLITFEYDQEQMTGPPFSVDEPEVKRWYTTAYSITSLVSRDVPGGLKGVCPAVERAWYLAPRDQGT